MHPGQSLHRRSLDPWENPLAPHSKYPSLKQIAQRATVGTLTGRKLQLEFQFVRNPVPSPDSPEKGLGSVMSGKPYLHIDLA